MLLPQKYDADDHVAAVICLDSYRNTMNYSDHYAIIKKTYYVDGKLRTEMFYDQDTSQRDQETDNAATFI